MPPTSQSLHRYSRSTAPLRLALICLAEPAAPASQCSLSGESHWTTRNPVCEQEPAGSRASGCSRKTTSPKWYTDSAAKRRTAERTCEALVNFTDHEGTPDCDGHSHENLALHPHSRARGYPRLLVSTWVRCGSELLASHSPR